MCLGDRPRVPHSWVAAEVRDGHNKVLKLFSDVIKGLYFSMGLGRDITCNSVCNLGRAQYEVNSICHSAVVVVSVSVDEVGFCCET